MYKSRPARIAFAIAVVCAALYSELPAHAGGPACDKENRVCVGDPIVTPFLTNGQLAAATVLAINRDGTYQVRMSSGRIRQETKDEVGFAGSGACIDPAGFCVSSTVQYKWKPGVAPEPVVAVFLSGKIAISDPSDSNKIYIEKSDDFNVLSSKYLGWVYATVDGKKQVSGCLEKDAQNPVYQRNAAISECVSAFTAHLAWDEKTRSCSYDTNDGVLITPKTPADCASLPDAQYYWIDESAHQCAAGTARGDFIVMVDASKCGAESSECLKGSGILASTSTAMISGTLYHLVPEILDLKDGQTVPADVYRKYSPDLIAASLVERYHDVNEATANAAKPAFDYEADSEVELKFSDSIIGLIMHGGFLNQHQYAASGGLYDPTARAQLEDSLMGVHLEPSYVDGIGNPVNSVRPKYAFLAFDRDSDGQHHDEFSHDYGDVVAVFNDEVKDRMTFTPVDSLIAKNHLGSVTPYTVQYRSTHPIQKITVAKNFGDYWEAQVWGDLGMSDVRYFLVNCPGDQPIPNASLDVLESLNLPIYDCRNADDASHLGRGGLIFAGSPKLAPRPLSQTGTETGQFISMPAAPVIDPPTSQKVRSISGSSANSITMRSTPTAIPPEGGMPSASASKKPSSLGLGGKPGP